MNTPAPLRNFVIRFTQLHDAGLEPARLQSEGTDLLRQLVAKDTWLPEAFARPSAERYSQYLLHCDPLERFSVVSFVWGPGQQTPLHDHRVWGLIGMLRGRETETQYVRAADGRFQAGDTTFLEPGDVAALSPGVNDYHRVANALEDRPSISIHVYCANIGCVSRATYDPTTVTASPFISGFSTQETPNLWNRSHERQQA